MADDLKALRDIISSAVDNISAVCEKLGKPFPSLDAPIHPSEYTPQGIRNDSAIARSISLIVSAATQLIATVRPPPATMTISAFRYTLPAALGVVEAGNIAEILRDAGRQESTSSNHALLKAICIPKSSVRISGHLCFNLYKQASSFAFLARILRYLATEHWFQEVRPDIFANNLLSSLLDSGKKISNGFDKTTKHDNSFGMSAIAGYGADDCLKSGAYLVEMMTDPDTKLSEEPNCSAMQKAFNMTDTIFEFFDRPTEQYRRNRFAVVMAGMNKIHPPTAILSGFDWEHLPDGGLVVDVGGGLGHVALEIAKTYPKLHIVIEDRPLVIDQAKPFWGKNLPSHVAENKVHFIGIDFFEAHPKFPGPVDVFLLRMIIHDWSDKYAIKLLRRLRNAAGPNTKLVIIDSVIEHVCGSGQKTKNASAPLLPNMGGASLLPYVMDVAVFGVINAGERTIEGFKDILEPSGWQLREIHNNAVSPVFEASVIATPI